MSTRARLCALLVVASIACRAVLDSLEIQGLSCW